MNANTNDDKSNNQEVTTPEDIVDENMSLFIYGNIKIRDVVTGEILINQRF